MVPVLSQVGKKLLGELPWADQKASPRALLRAPVEETRVVLVTKQQAGFGLRQDIEVYKQGLHQLGLPADAISCFEFTFYTRGAKLSERLAMPFLVMTVFDLHLEKMRCCVHVLLLSMISLQLLYAVVIMSCSRKG